MAEVKRSDFYFPNTELDLVLRIWRHLVCTTTDAAGVAATEDCQFEPVANASVTLHPDTDEDDGLQSQTGEDGYVAYKVPVSKVEKMGRHPFITVEGKKVVCDDLIKMVADAQETMAEIHKVDADVAQRHAEEDKARQRRAEEQAETLRRRRQMGAIGIINEDPRRDTDDNPWIKFQVIANQKIRKKWLKVTARCKDEGRIKTAEDTSLLNHMEPDESQAFDTPFGEISLSGNVQWCEFEYRFARDPFSSGKHIITLCWMNGVVEGRCPR